MKKIKEVLDHPLWRLCIDLIQISGVSLLAVFGTVGVFKLILGNSLIILLFIGLCIAIFLWLREKFTLSFRAFQDKKTKYEGERIQEKLNQDFVSGIPSNGILKSWFKMIRRRVDKWDPEAELKSLNLYLRHGTDIPFLQFWPKLQAYFVSKNKNLVATFYIPSSNEIEEISEDKSYDKPKNPFFVTYPKWKNALIKAYSAVSDLLPKSFEVQVADGDNEITFNFRYKVGLVSKLSSFTYNGNLLKNGGGRVTPVN